MYNYQTISIREEGCNLKDKKRLENTVSDNNSKDVQLRLFRQVPDLGIENRYFYQTMDII